MIESKDVFTVTGPTSAGRPFLNENQFGALSVSTTFLADKRTLMNWIKRTPECIGILRQIANDIITRINFISIEEQTMGRPKKNLGKDNEAKASEFAKKHFLKNTLRAMIMEGIALGDGYVWKDKIDDEDFKEIALNTFKQFGLKPEYKEFKLIDENFVAEKKLQYVASSTMNIKLDNTGTKMDFYVQRVATGFGTSTFPSTNVASDQTGSPHKTRKWKPEQIIHWKFMDFDGKVHGFTPMQSSFPLIKTLGAIKDYHGHYFDSGVLPDTIFNFEELDANSPEYEKLEQAIQTWYNNKRRGHLLTTSKFKLEKINEWNKDMEFRLLAIQWVGTIAFSVGFPLEKIRAILGGEIKSTTGGSDIGNTDYQRNIFDMQDDVELLFNTQFFNEEFQVDLKLDRSAARDEIAEVQRDAQKLNNYEKTKQMDLIKKDKLPMLYASLFPDIPKDWINPNPEPEMGMGGMIPSSKALPKGQGSEALSNEKKAQQKPQQKNKPPQGI